MFGSSALSLPFSLTVCVLREVCACAESRHSGSLKEVKDRGFWASVTQHELSLGRADRFYIYYTGYSILTNCKCFLCDD